jgi:hypothetical protein
MYRTSMGRALQAVGLRLALANMLKPVTKVIYI